jgi:hypothetical protein
MTEVGSKALIRRFIDEAITRKDSRVLDALVAEDFVEHVPFRGQGPGREGLRQAIVLFHGAFPDFL